LLGARTCTTALPPSGDGKSEARRANPVFAGNRRAAAAAAVTGERPELGAILMEMKDARIRDRLERTVALIAGSQGYG
jgi:hypothetical protein